MFFVFSFEAKMGSLNLYERFSRTFREHPSLSKFLVVFALRPCVVVRVNNVLIIGRFPPYGSTVTKGHYWAFF
ncbi:hypothetical protein HanXRQr2_Chr01g0006041 [Helianthus annuus]|uniref:Uncharacterized protein n=1 Tax=Helianthus annuus TaxID=4232 RepID=A0A251VMA9_HELAN|nr:hypothetical protein HanXRQr2_Chr01g0006041 [Helianthus annuus]